MVLTAAVQADNILHSIRPTEENHMTREQILQIVRAAPNVGKVTHEEFADYVLALAQRKKTDEGWQTTEHPYMTVDGKLAMANQDHARQNKRLDFGPPQVLADNDEQLTILVTVTSEIYGTRHGIATSRKIGGTAAEREFPWEVAETSAIGRALSTMGYGVFPGSGLASADDMIRATAPAETGRRANVEPERRTAAQTTAPRSMNETRPAYSRSHPPLSPIQRNKLSELWRILHAVGDTSSVAPEDVEEGLNKLFNEHFRHGLAEATYEEGARLTGQLLSELRQKTSQPQ
jgi:hypothetical protein